MSTPHRDVVMNHRGQSALEYILVLAAVLLALIGAAIHFINPAADHTMDASQRLIQNSANRIRNGLRGL